MRKSGGEKLRDANLNLPSEEKFFKELLIALNK